ncbi:MAG TPA: creatininase family protein [Gemmatimonadaceae bacterium]|nr:creatininase family protein [Gemmatimonadaceae bacterium]
MSDDKPRPWVLAESTWRTVDATPYDIALLPWGATEAHNRHLPYATDTIQCDHLAAAAAGRAWERGARAIVLPTVPFGVNTTQLDVKLCLNMNPSTQAALLRDLVSVVAGHGIRRLVIFNGHGGNDFRQIIRELQPTTPVFLASLDWWKVLDGRRYFDEAGDHAGELETSVMLHVAPELVAPLDTAGPGTERRFKLRALRERWVWAPRQWTAVTADTGIGDPRAATAEKGARYVADLTDALATFLVDFAAADLADMYE